MTLRIALLAFALPACTALIGDPIVGGSTPDGALADAGEATDAVPSPDGPGALEDAAPSDLLSPSDMTTCPANAACKPGDVQYTPDGCEQKTCVVPGCYWSAWGLRAGAMCPTGGTQSCNAGGGCPTLGTQTCVACQWAACTCN